MDQDTGQVTATAFLFDMWRIFEDFVTTSLAHNLEVHGGTARRQATGKYLDAGSNIALRPDLLWSDANGTLAVIDAKYKDPKFANYPNADIYQMLAYCVRFRLNTGHLIYASGEGEARTYEILGHEATVHCHTIDLSQTPNALLRQMSKLAETISR